MESEKLGVLGNLEDPPGLFPVRELSDAVGQMARLQDLVARHSAEEASLSQLESPPKLDDTRELDALIEKKFRLQQAVKVNGELAERMANLSQPPQLNDESRPHWHYCCD